MRDDADRDKNASEKITCSTFLADAQHFASTVIKRDADIGSHALRNTTHLLGTLGGGNRDGLHKSARPKSAENYNRHEQDNVTLFELLQRCSSSNSTSLLVPKLG